MKIELITFSACGTCPAAGPTIGATDANTGAQAFNPMTPVAGQGEDGCATLTYTCSGIAANVDVRKLSCSEV